MARPPASPPDVFPPRTVQMAISASLVVMLSGLVLPAFRTWRQWQTEQRARHEMAAIGAGLCRFMETTALPPTRGKDGSPRALHRLLGPGLIAEGTYYYPDEHQGNLADHLMANAPQGKRQPGYPEWKGPYLERLTADPWGYAYVVVVYPLALEDDRDCIVVSAGPNGRMEGNYGSPRDAVEAGDDLIEVAVEKSPSRRAPLR